MAKGMMHNQKWEVSGDEIKGEKREKIACLYIQIQH
jgi:hypothetical protein